MAEPSAVKRERIPLATKLIYASPAFAGSALALPIFVFMPKFYSDDVGAPLGFIALAIAFARSFDAITDPMMGWISDRTKTRWGRRRPWLAVGAPLAAVAAFALFSPPNDLTTVTAAWWFLGAFSLYFLFHTIYEIPYLALGSELSMDYHERSSLFGWRTAIALVGQTVAGAGLFLFGSDDPAANRVAFTGMGMFYAGLLVAFYALLIARVRERPDFVKRESNPLIPGVRRAVRNAPFRIILLSYVVTSITGAIPATLAPFFIEYVLQPENPESIVGLTILLYIGAGVLSIPGWVALSKRFGKRKTWLWSFWIGIAASTSLFFLGEGDTPLFILLIPIMGLGNGSALLHPSMQADIIDYDELLTGKRREAQYNSFWGIVPKFVAIPSAAVPLAVLAQMGYVANQPQSETVTYALRLIFLAPALANLIGFAIALRFPMTERVHRAVLAAIDQHKQGQPAEDPITGRTIPCPFGNLEVDRRGWFLDHFSRGELRRSLRLGPQALLVNILAVAATAFFACGGLVWWVTSQLADLGDEPGVLVTLAIVLAGCCLTAFLFQLVKLGPARRFGSEVSSTQVSSHLRGASEAEPAPVPAVEDAP